MSIVRAVRKHQFAIVPTHVVEDDRLSWEARGLLIYLLSKPDHWTVQPQDLINRTKKAIGKKSGRDKVYSILNELRAAGYVYRDYNRVGGNFQGVEYEVSEIPDLDAAAAYVASVERKKTAPFTDLPETVAPGRDLPDTAQPFTAKAETLDSTESAISTEKAVKHLNAKPGANDERVDVDELTEAQRETLALAPANYPQSQKSKTFATWLAYAIEFKDRYHEWPVYNATVGSQVSKLVDRIGAADAPLVARYYVKHVKTPAITDSHHPISSLLRQCEAYVVKARTHQKRLDRAAATAQAVAIAAEAAEMAAKAVQAPLQPVPKGEITERAKEGRAALGNILGGKLRQRMTA